MERNEGIKVFKGVLIGLPFCWVFWIVVSAIVQRVWFPL